MTLIGSRDSTRSEMGQRQRQGFRGLINWRIASTALVLATLAVFFHFASGEVFFTPRNLSLLLRQCALTAIMAGGVSVILIMAEIDLSIGSAVFLTGTVAAQVSVTYGLPTWLGVVAALGTGIGLGAWNGFWTTRMMVPSFVVTLAGLLAFQGVGLIWTNAGTIGPLSPGFINLSEAFIPKNLSSVLLVALGLLLVATALRRQRIDRRRHPEDIIKGKGVLRLAAIAVLIGLAVWISSGFLGLPTAVIWMMAVGALLFFIMSQTKFGRNAYMIGANREAAYLAGINVRRHVFAGFVLMGLLYGIGGILLDARLGVSSPVAGQSLLLDALAAAVIGGTSLMGGVGTIPGAMVGALLLATIDNGMDLLNANSFVQQVVKALILLFAVALDQWANRRRSPS